MAYFNSGETQFLTRPENRSKASKRRIKIKISRTGKRGTQFRTITFQPSSPSCRARRVFDENCATRPSSSRRTVSVREFYEIYGTVPRPPRVLTFGRSAPTRRFLRASNSATVNFWPGEERVEVAAGRQTKNNGRHR